MEFVAPHRSGSPGRLLAVLIVATMAAGSLFPAGLAAAAPRHALTPVGATAHVPSAASSGHPGTPASSVKPLLASPGWYKLATRVSPSARTYPAFAWDAQAGGDILFGGNDISGLVDRDTWQLTNGVWRDLTSGLSTAPLARYGMNMVWDAHDSELVMFGGRNSPTKFLGDTWIFNSTGWYNVTSGTGPSSRAYYGIFYDPTIAKVVLYGGAINLGTAKTPNWIAFNDTWEFQAGTWTNVTSAVSTTAATSPPRTVAPYAGWDTADSYGVIYGGAQAYSGCPDYNTTWKFSASGWTNISGFTNPGNFSSGSGAYDAIDGYFLTFGGWYPNAAKANACQSPANTWKFLAGTWTNDSATGAGSTPTGRFGATATYDPIMKDVVFFGGEEPRTSTYVNEVWTWPAGVYSAAISTANTELPVNTNLAFTLTFTGGLGPYSFNWSFNDLTKNATTQNCSHTYTSTGVYTVNVQIVDAQGRSFNTSIVITIVPKLTAVATDLPLVGEAPLKVQFNATFAGGVPAIYTNWNFGDKANSGTRNLTHTYNAAGTYNVSFRVNDSAAEAVYINSTIQVYSKIAGSINQSSMIFASPKTVTFGANGSQGLGPYTYTWNFGDGTPNSTGQTVQHLFTDVPIETNYTVSVIVSDTLGYQAYASIVARVYPALTFSIDPSTTGRVPPPLAVTFSASGGGGVPPDTFLWNFSDGSADAVGEVTSHTFQKAGTFNVTLLITDAYNDTQLNYTVIYVVNPLAGNFTESINSGPAPLNVTFSASGSGGIPAKSGYTYAWAFGDGNTGAGQTVTHVYRTLGNFTVTATYGDSIGDSASSSKRVHTYLALSLGVTANPTVFYLGNSTTLTANARAGNGTRSYAWSGLPSGCSPKDVSSINCIPTATGNFVVNVSVTTTGGDAANGSITLSVLKSTTGPGGPTGGSNKTTSSSGIPLAYLLIIAVIVVVAIIGIVLALRRGGAGGGGAAVAPEDEEEVGPGGDASGAETLYGVTEPAPGGEEGGTTVDYDPGTIYGGEPAAPTDEEE